MIRFIGRSFLGGLMCGVLAIMLSAPAAAHLQTKSDPDDTLGPLDIRESSFRHANGRFILTLTTQGAWTVETLKYAEVGSKERLENFFQFQLDSRGNGYADYFVIVDNYGGQLKGKLFHWVPPYPTLKSEFVANVGASKDGKTVKVKFRKGKVNPRDTFIGWNAFSRFSDKGTCGSSCEDEAPNSKIYVHNL